MRKRKQFNLLLVSAVLATLAMITIVLAATTSISNPFHVFPTDPSGSSSNSGNLGFGLGPGLASIVIECNDHITHLTRDTVGDGTDGVLSCPEGHQKICRDICVEKADINSPKNPTGDGEYDIRGVDPSLRCGEAGITQSSCYCVPDFGAGDSITGGAVTNPDTPACGGDGQDPCPEAPSGEFDPVWCDTTVAMPIEGSNSCPEDTVSSGAGFICDPTITDDCTENSGVDPFVPTRKGGWCDPLIAYPGKEDPCSVGVGIPQLGFTPIVDKGILVSCGGSSTLLTPEDFIDDGIDPYGQDSEDPREELRRWTPPPTPSSSEDVCIIDVCTWRCVGDNQNPHCEELEYICYTAYDYSSCTEI